MSNWNLRSDFLADIATISRAQSDQIYPSGTIYVQVSACKKYTSAIWNILEQPSRLESKYAVISPKVDFVPHYMVVALERVTDEWMSRYIGSNINIAMDAFNHLKVDWHPDVRQQLEILSRLKPVDDMIKQVEETIRLEKEAKRWLLSKMLV